MAARSPAPVLTLVTGMAGTGGHIQPSRAGLLPLRAAGTADGNEAGITPAVVWKLVDALPDGVVLCGPDGTIGLTNARLEDMFGYQRGELPGHPVEFPAEISLSPVTTPADQFALAVIRDVTEEGRMEDRAAAIAGEQLRRSEQVVDTIVTGLFGAGLSLQAALDLSPDAVRQSIAAAVTHLDDTIRQIRHTAFSTGSDRTSDQVAADAST